MQFLCIGFITCLSRDFALLQANAELVAMPEQASSKTRNAPLQMQFCMGVTRVKGLIIVDISQYRYPTHIQSARADIAEHLVSP